jgi:hypothetical protein
MMNGKAGNILPGRMKQEKRYVQYDTSLVSTDEFKCRRYLLKLLSVSASGGKRCKQGCTCTALYSRGQTCNADRKKNDLM